MVTATKTAYYDLLGIMYLLSTKNNKKFTAVPVSSLARDICLIIYQINKDILNNSIILDDNIKKIRHKVKLNNGKRNFKVFESIYNYHIQQFGNDIDNIGFYLEGKKLIGSTIYTTYIYHDTSIFDLENSVKTGNRAIEFFEYIGETSVLLLEKVCEKSNFELPFVIPEALNYEDMEGYKNKDIHHNKLFGDSDKKNVLITRFLLTQNELSTCLWLGRGISYNNSELTLDSYILLRLISIKLDQIMDNLLNIQEFMVDEFKEADVKCKNKISFYISKYKVDLQDECSRLRNMIHYNDDEENFLDFVMERMNLNYDYINNLINKMIVEYIEPLSDIISTYFEIRKKRSMTLPEKVMRRIYSKSKKK